MCICLLRNIIIHPEGTKLDPSVPRNFTNSCILSDQKNVSGRPFSRSSKGATDVINLFIAHFNGPAAAILSQNQ
jgi:hypothetical protein